MKPLMTRALSVAALLCASLPAAAAERPVVVELFTSQGCSSCPPADALLGELAHQPNVLALAFHVDYWNRLGWKDPYSSPLATERQRAYARALSLSSVYTPQMVVDGEYDVVGSDRPAVAQAVALAGKSGESVTVGLAGDGGNLHLSVAPSPSGTGTGSVWLAFYDRTHTTRIGAGENGGRTLTEFNVVRSFVRVGDWQGAALDLEVPVDRPGGADSAALLVQAPDGKIIGAATLNLAPTTN